MPAPVCSYYQTDVAHAQKGGLRSLGLACPPVHAWVSCATQHSSLRNVILAQSATCIARDGKYQLLMDGGGEVCIPFPSSFSLAETRLRNSTK